jgi:hypothetical protein
MPIFMLRNPLLVAVGGLVALALIFVGIDAIGKATERTPTSPCAVLNPTGAQATACLEEQGGIPATPSGSMSQLGIEQALELARV